MTAASGSRGPHSKPSMAYKVEFLPEAAREFDALDGSLKRIAARQIDKLALNPELGEPLGNRMRIDLSG